VARRRKSAATCSRWFSLVDFSTLKMEAIRYSETSVHGATSQKTVFFIVTVGKI
jgi:hypothetical protein